MRYIVVVVLLLLTPITRGSEEEWTFRHVRLLVTGYCPGECCCGDHADGLTATGEDAQNPGVAVDPELIRLGARLDIPGYGELRGWWSPADDVGGKIKGNRIDVRFASHREAIEWGKKLLKVRVWEKSQ